MNEKEYSIQFYSHIINFQPNSFLTNASNIQKYLFYFLNTTIHVGGLVTLDVFLNKISVVILVIMIASVYYIVINMLIPNQLVYSIHVTSPRYATENDKV